MRSIPSFTALGRRERTPTFITPACMNTASRRPEKATSVATGAGGVMTLDELPQRLGEFVECAGVALNKEIGQAKKS
jgi:hypothetical protein